MTYPTTAPAPPRVPLVGLFLALLLICPAPGADQITDLLTGAADKGEASSKPTISADSPTKDDSKIRRRLQGIFKEIKALEGISVKVSGGIVTLSGEVESAAAENEALVFANKVQGVVEVENGLTVNRELQPRLAAMWRKILDLGQRFLAALPLFALALAVLVLFWLAGRWLAARQGLFRRITPNHFIAGLLGQVTQLVFIMIGLMLALVLLDATALIGTILGTAGIIGLAVGFAVRDTVENYIASVLLSLRNPFAFNDFVNIDGHMGNVVRLTSRATILLSPDGCFVRIPNATVFKAVIVNYSRNAERRFDFEVGVDTEQDLVSAQALALQSLVGVTGVLQQPKPIVVVESLGDSNVILRCYAWLDQTRVDYLKVRSEAIRAVKSAFDEAGIVMPEPIYSVRLFEAGTPVRQRTDTPDMAAKHAAPRTTSTPPIETVKPVPTGDVSRDQTIEDKVKASEAASTDTNLLRDDAAREV